MPKYDYYCDHCGLSFTYRHSVDETLETHPNCDKELCSVRKVPSFYRILAREQDKRGMKPGTLVKKYIEDVKEETEEMKKELEKEDFEL